MFISPMRYGFTGMMVTQFPVDNTPETKRLSQELLNTYGFEDKTFWGCFFCLVGLFILFRSLVVLILWCQDMQKRGKARGDTRNTDLSSLFDIREETEDHTRDH